MKKKFKGFSLAELLISLLIISIVLSAAIPTVTRKMSADRAEQIWRWDEVGKNNAYFGVGTNQTALIGISQYPIDSTSAGFSLTNILKDTEATDLNNHPDEDIKDPTRNVIGDVNVGDVKFSTFGDKLLLLKRNVQGSTSNFVNSHISFFNMSNSGSSTIADAEYAGRLAMDTGNIALGLGSLQKINHNNNGENTALGHFALLRTDEGYRNTAVGKKSLSFNEKGSYNTAVGFGSLFGLGYEPDTLNAEPYFENTAVGALSQQLRATGKFNTTVGSQSLKRNKNGDNNTAVGRLSLSNNIIGSGNTSLGAEACKYIEEGSGNICIGYRVANDKNLKMDNYGLYIGTADIAGDVTPLISGHTRRMAAENIDKELNINARYFNVNTYETGENIFNITTWSGSDGYGQNLATTGYHGTFLFGLRKNGTETTSIQFLGQKDYASINTIDEIGTGKKDLVFNDYLTFGYPKNTTDDLRIYTAPVTGGAAGSTYPLLLNTKMKIDSASPFTLNLTSNEGFALNNSSNNTGLTFDKNGSVNLRAAGAIYLSNTTGNLSIITGNTLNFEAAGNSIVADSSNGIVMGPSVKVGNVKIGQNDIEISSISGSMGKGVATNINYLTQMFQSLSDERKKDILGDSTAGLKEINALEVKNYTYKDDEKKEPHVGVIAQQLQKVFPNSVFEGKDGFLRIKREEMFYAMINAIKELCAQIQDITAKITGLDKKITELENQNKMLIEQNKAFEKRLEKLEKQAQK